MRQLIVFRRDLEKIEESVIKEEGLKLTKDRQRKRSVKNLDAFKQGRIDTKEINITAPRIEDGKVDMFLWWGSGMPARPRQKAGGAK